MKADGPQIDDWSWATDEMFDNALDEVIKDYGVMHIPGVYELVKEYYNNDVLDRLRVNREEEEE